MQLVVLIVGPGKYQEVATFSALLPALELLESIAPMPSATKQTNQHQFRLISSGGEVVVELGRMGQTVQG
jgi:hypothetical protein